MDKTIDNIFKNSSKAEFLEFVNEHLPDCYRAIVIFEKRGEPDTSKFEYYQHGFNQYYEVAGFLIWARDLVAQANEDDDE